MAMQWTLEEIDNMIATLDTNERNYNENIASLKTEVDIVNNNWVSKETQTYETFKSNFNDKYPRMLKCDDLLVAFKKALAAKREEIEEQENATKGQLE